MVDTGTGPGPGPGVIPAAGDVGAAPSGHHRSGHQGSGHDGSGHQGSGHDGSGHHGPGERLGPVRRALREVGLGLITGGVIILLFVTYQLWGTGLAEANNQAALQRSFDQQLAGGGRPATSHGSTPANTTPGGDAPAVGTPVPGPPGAGAIDHLVIPKIGVDKFVVEGVGEGDLRRGPGHYPQTVLPGEKGNAAIAGHRTTYGAPFYRLNELRPGDDILITDTAGRTFDYRVTQAAVVSPGDVSVLDPTPDARLTLTTCNPRFSASTRLVVVAALTGNPAPVAPARAPITSPANTGSPPAALTDNLGRGDKGAWPPAVAYGAVVVALWVATRVLINRTRRWRRAAVCMCGITVCLVPLWFCFENAVRLLPQNI